MNILDENILIEARQQLHHWRIPVRHIGYDLGRAGIQDDEIIRFYINYVTQLSLHVIGIFMNVICVMRAIVWSISM